VKKNLVLLGMMAAGKSTIGKMVAKKQKLEFFDTDLVIEKKHSMKIKDIFSKRGEKFFRNEEQKEVSKILEKENCVIAIGGGAFLNKNLRENILKKSCSIWLNVSIDVLNKRVAWNKKRPLLKKWNNKKKLNELYEERKDIYKLANYKIECNKLSKENVVKKIITLYEKF
jgi:shikimate kinase